MKDTIKVKWGIVGLGKIAHQFAKELLLVDDAEICAVASRSIEKATDFANQYNCKNAYASYDEIFKDKNIDIVYIATPHDSHAELSIKAMQNNKHVLCEKPLALRYEDAWKMIEASKKNNKFFMEAFWTRFNPSVREAVDKIRNGEIGEVKYINADFAFQVKKIDGGRMTDISLGGGSLLDIGVYPLFLAYLILGIPNGFVAKAHFHDSGADLQTSMILQFSDAQAVLHSSFVSSSNMEATISGSEGRIILNSLWYEAQSYTVIKNENKVVYNLPTKGKGYTHEIEECHKCLKENSIESALWSHQNSLDLIKIVDGIRGEIGLIYPSDKV